MIECVFRPLTDWPGQRTTQRRRAPFKTSWPRTLDHIERELCHLGARNIVFEIALDASEIRNDGWPRANSYPRHPGVVISFNSKHGPLRYPCDTYTDWQANVRAVSLAMQALRAVDRYGVTKRGEQYTGWSQLPPPGGTIVNGEMSMDEALRVIGVGESLNDVEKRCVWRDCYRARAARLHPDTPVTGDEAAFKRLQAAKRTIEAVYEKQTGGSVTQ